MLIWKTLDPNVMAFPMFFPKLERQVISKARSLDIQRWGCELLRSLSQPYWAMEKSMDKSTTNGHFQQLFVCLPEGNVFVLRLCFVLGS